jgi:hypothetical protein
MSPPGLPAHFVYVVLQELRMSDQERLREA